MANSRLQTLLSYMRPHWRLVALGITALFVVNTLSAYIPILIGKSIDSIEVEPGSTPNFAPLWGYAFAILTLASVMWIIRMLSRLWLFGVGRAVEFDLKQRIFEHLLKLEPGYFATHGSGDLINRATSDVDNIRRLVGFAVLSVVNTIFAYGMTLPFMLAIDARLSLLGLFPYPFILLTVHLASDRLRLEQARVQENLSDLGNLIQEDMSGISLIKIYAQEANERRAFGEKNRHLLDANLKLAKTRNLLFPVIEGIASLSLLVLLWVGSQELARNTITNGDFVVLIFFAQRLVFPIALLGFTITAYQRGEVSVERVEAILSVEPQIKDPPNPIALPLESVAGRLDARHLSYTYPGTNAPALDDVNFNIEPGETIAIVGSIGSGKSTLANALTHLLEIDAGQLFLDGKDIASIALHDLRRAIAYVPQDSFLFSTTVGNNIRYGRPDATQEAIERAAKQAQIHTEIDRFPQQYETIVGERGITLSGGQRQRSALARALLMEAPVLILDDALSSVDNQTATEILQHLATGVPRTVIFISHQLSAAAQADRLFVMDSGKIVQAGAHEALLATPGLYRSLWQQHQLETAIRST